MAGVYTIFLTVYFGIAVGQRKFLTGNFRWLFYLMCVTWVVETLGYFLKHHVNTNPMYHAFQPVEYALYSLFFSETLRQPLVKRFVAISIGLYALFAVCNVLFFQSLHIPGSYNFILEASLLLTWTLVYFYQLYVFFEPQKVWQVPEFWVCTGILFFYAGTFFQMGLHSYLIRSNRELANRLYVINHLLNILLYGLITVGFLCKASQKKLSSSS